MIRTVDVYAEIRVDRLLLMATMLCGTGGCGTIHFDVPRGTRVRLLELDEPTSIHIEKTVWFALWGAEPLSDNHTASLIAGYDIKECRLSNRYSLSDSLINTVTSIFSFSRRRMIIEGNQIARGPPT
jgi:hypothetical protein